MEGTTVNKIHILLGDLSDLSDPLTVPDLIPSGLLSLLSPPTPQSRYSLAASVAQVSGRAKLPLDTDLLLVPSQALVATPARKFSELAFV